MSEHPSALAIVAGAFAAAIAPDPRGMEARSFPIAPALAPILEARRPAPGSREALDAEILQAECAKLEAEMAAVALNEARLAEARQIFDRALAGRRLAQPGSIPLAIPPGRLVFAPAVPGAR